MYTLAGSPAPPSTARWRGRTQPERRASRCQCAVVAVAVTSRCHAILFVWLSIAVTGSSRRVHTPGVQQPDVSVAVPKRVAHASAPRIFRRVKKRSLHPTPHTPTVKTLTRRCTAHDRLEHRRRLCPSLRPGTRQSLLRRHPGLECVRDDTSVPACAGFRCRPRAAARSSPWLPGSVYAAGSLRGLVLRRPTCRRITRRSSPRASTSRGLRPADPGGWRL